MTADSQDWVTNSDIARLILGERVLPSGDESYAFKLDHRYLAERSLKYLVVDCDLQVEMVEL